MRKSTLIAMSVLTAAPPIEDNVPLHGLRLAGTMFALRFALRFAVLRGSLP